MGPADSSSFALVSDEFDMIPAVAVRIKGVEIVSRRPLGSTFSQSGQGLRTIQTIV